MLRKSNYFICENCKIRYEKGWLEYDAIQEFKTDYPDMLNDELGVLCDDCHILFKKWYNTLSEDEKQRMRDEYSKVK